MEIEMMSQVVYETKYNAFSAHVDFLVLAMSEEAGTTVNSAAKAGGEDGVQALFDAVMDAGHRMVLVKALNSPAISGWVRERLEVFLYGQHKQQPRLFKRTYH
jgi:hypothetical protein